MEKTIQQWLIFEVTWLLGSKYYLKSAIILLNLSMKMIFYIILEIFFFKTYILFSKMFTYTLWSYASPSPNSSYVFLLPTSAPYSPNLMFFLPLLQVQGSMQERRWNDFQVQCWQMTLRQQCFPGPKGLVHGWTHRNCGHFHNPVQSHAGQSFTPNLEATSKWYLLGEGNFFVPNGMTLVHQPKSRGRPKT